MKENMPHWLPKKTLHAIEAVLCIACEAQHEPVSGKDLSAKLGFPARYLEQLMQQLVRQGILRGIRGPKGGYVLARERRRISMADIITALQEPESDGHGQSEPPFCSSYGPALLQPALAHAYDSLLESLQGITLAELCTQMLSQDPAAQAGKGKKKSDFVI